MLNRKLDAKEALHHGLISRIIEEKEGQAFGQIVQQELKQAIADYSTESMIASKSLIMDQETRDQLKAVMRRENDVLTERWTSDEFPAFIMKFMMKKKGA